MKLVFNGVSAFLAEASVGLTTIQVRLETQSVLSLGLQCTHSTSTLVLGLNSNIIWILYLSVVFSGFHSSVG